VKQLSVYTHPVVIDCDHSMSIMTDETFGPVAAIMKVSSDAEAVKLMNDSPYGLTASVWTDAAAADSHDAFLAIVDQLETGTVFLNAADYLDPALAWSGHKDSGRGVSLSKFGFDAFTRTKSVNMHL
jgi:acyl-CoA reductase-like NAD-dependent aldehyde dehydrogenase